MPSFKMESVHENQIMRFILLGSSCLFTISPKSVGRVEQMWFLSQKSQFAIIKMSVIYYPRYVERISDNYFSNLSVVLFEKNRPGTIQWR